MVRGRCFYIGIADGELLVQVSVVAMLPRLLRNFIHRDVLKQTRGGKLTRVRLRGLESCTAGGFHEISSCPFKNFTKVIVRYRPVSHYVSTLGTRHSCSRIVFAAPSNGRFSRPVTGDLSLYRGLVVLYKRCGNVSCHVQRRLVAGRIDVNSCMLAKKRLTTTIVASTVMHVVPNIVKSRRDTLSSSFRSGLLTTPICAQPTSCGN